MRFRLKTLIDITETGARRTDNNKQYRQQQNWMTMLQTLGLRANPIILKQTTEHKGAKANGFGSSYSGPQKTWVIDFEIEREDGLSIEQLIEDFDFVPVITDLDETVNLPQNIFITRDEKNINITFEEV